ncbi:phosphoheptose isomerase [Bernardetia litoralis DSM 6794]|uniref:Phosphoheptose isomerase n=1 Tax=Bernardetia litoralis (strain ATCC 23117 / DSM 6794 / NBRC 15988 / NCIMB 1366 / Fx l1 / Sio-4) TaxID=880071 RepID=I4AN05_BERLS|nr:D-sedoheptulose 7-phosphate isomerase [Bernardetia litoralis]AFM05340.1 phosphoheptose isomerase [Bernardetia litoralis DSM 6794]
MNKNFINTRIQESIATKERIMTNEPLLKSIEKAAQAWKTTFEKGGKVLFCGNGGSAADAQHISAELSGRFYKDRKPLFAEALHVNSSYLTAVGNDYGYDIVFERMVQAMGREGDVLVAISTSGNSPNIVKAVEAANKIGMITIGMTGSKGGKLKEICDIILNVPSDDTPRIQESHILVGHILCEWVELALFE